MRFHVLQSSKDGFMPARHPYFMVIDKNKGWLENAFDSWIEASSYAINWLGQYAPPDVTKLKLGEVYHYSGYGDSIVIIIDK